MRRAWPWIWGVVGVGAVIGIWELYKAFGPADGVTVGGMLILPRAHDRSMPHVWDMLARLAAPTLGEGTPPLWLTVLQGLVVTLGIAALGLAIGLVVGVLLALLMERARVLEWGILPWVVVSQTVPLIAFAPVISTIGKQIDRGGFPFPEWLSVAVVASYLAFFPIAVGVLRGLQAPDRIHLELMRTYAAGYGATLRKLRVPAAIPYFLPALKLAAANAVIGAIVAEVSIGMPGGLGRMFIQFASSASADPALPWAPMFGAVVLGFVAAGSVALLGFVLKNYRRGEAVA